MRIAILAIRFGTRVQLSGYTDDAPPPLGPDFDLVVTLAGKVTIPIYAEGRYSTPEQIARARNLGATFVVVGGAITDPVALTRRLAAPFATEDAS
jgi:N-acylglucosamine-6-phosphate 2-epimerase